MRFTDSSISFVMPAYNCQDTIVESVESIIHGNFEQGDQLIIVDDCSTDDTAQVLSNLKREYPFIVVVRSAENKGCPATRNIGIGKASNPTIFNLDSDNILVPRSIRRLRHFMISENADLAAFGQFHFFQNNIDEVKVKWICRSGLLTLADFLSGSVNPGPSGNFMYTKRSWERVGGYWEYGSGLHEAWGFTLKQIAMGARFVVMPKTYYWHRHGHDSLYVREARKRNESSLMATKMITPFLHLVDDAQAAYIRSEEGSQTWFESPDMWPLRLKTGEQGKTGYVAYPAPSLTSRIPSILGGIKNRIIAKISGLRARN